jgi:hypothetical protein
MKRTFLLALGLFLAAPSLAGAAECRPSKPPRVTVELVEAPLKEDRALGIAALSKIEDGPALPGLEDYDYTFGLTETRLEARAVAAIEGDMRGTQICAFNTKVAVTLHWQFEVRLASEIEVGTCIDREVRRHEQLHVAQGRRLMPVIRDRMMSAVRAAAADGAAGPDFDAAKKELWARVSAAIDGVNADSIAMVKAAKAALDTPSEYAKLPQACGNAALQALIRKNRR